MADNETVTAAADMLATDIVQQFFTSVLADMPYPVSQPPGHGSAETYVVFNEVDGSGTMASNDIQRLRHLVQLHAYTRSDNDEHRAAFFMALAKLKKAGVRVYGWGPDEYEQDTGKHHIACTCTWWQTPGAMIQTNHEEREDQENE